MTADTGRAAARGDGFRVVRHGRRDEFVVFSALLARLGVPAGEARLLAERARRGEFDAPLRAAAVREEFDRKDAEAEAARAAA